MSDRWTDYFTKETGKYHSLLEYAVNHWQYNDPLYYRIRKLMTPPRKILDVGCGLGLSDIYLQECGYQVVGLDSDPNIIRQAQEHSRLFNSGAKFEPGDAFNLADRRNAYDLVYSVGLVEHFERKVTVDLIREQAKCAPYVITVIPTKFTRYSGKITDERIYDQAQLKKIFEEAGLTVIGQCGYGRISSPLHNWIYRVLPHAIQRLLQDHFSYAMDIVCIGRKK